MKLTGFLLIIACSLAYFSQAEGFCCRSSLVLYFAVDGGACGQAGETTTTNKGCKITICANGRPKMDKYCRHGSCNSDGCGCTAGCITGNWQ